MRKIALVCIVVFVLLAMAAWAQVTFSPPGSNEKFTGKMMTMLQTSVAKRTNTTGSVLVGSNANHNMWAIRAKVRNAQPNVRYALALVSANNAFMLGSAKMTDSSGSVELNWSGNRNPMTYTDIAVYYLPTQSSQPQKGAVRMLSVKTSSVSSTGGAAGEGPRRK